MAEEMCDLCGIEPPRIFSTVRNADPTGRQVTQAFNQAGRSLVSEYMWQELKAEEEVKLIAGQESYKLSERPKRVHSGAIFDDARNRRSVFPVSSPRWLEAKHGVYTDPNAYIIWPSGDRIHVHPKPGENPGTLKLIINGTKWVETAAGLKRSAFENDSDEPRLNALMIVQEARWRFLKIRKFPYQDEMEEARRFTLRQQNRNGGMARVSFGEDHMSGITDPFPENTVPLA